MFSPTSALRSVGAAATTATVAASRGQIKHVQVIVSPPPRNLAHTRLVLASLQKFGEVTAFRHLRNHPDEHEVSRPQGTSLAIFETSESAASAIEASPFYIPNLKKADPPKQHNEHALVPAAEPEAHIDLFRCEIQESDHDHEADIKEHPNYGPIRVDDSTLQYRDLVNSGIPQAQLADGPWSRLGKLFKISPLLGAYVHVDRGETTLQTLYRKGLGRVELESTGARTAKLNSVPQRERRTWGDD